MKITGIEVYELQIPFSRGVEKKAPTSFLKADALDFCLVKIETDVGIIGWGDAFAFHCRRAVAEAINHMIKPHLIGKDPMNVQQINFELQKTLHLFGRYGITMFAISAVDIALWDIVSKFSNLPLYNILGSSGDKKMPAYASLWRYEDAESVQDRCKHAINLGYKYIKLHEVFTSEVEAAREAVGEDIPIMVDTNCPWTKDQAKQMLNVWEDYNLYWVEEPINPPEDFESLSNLRTEIFTPIAAGENACTSFEFKKMQTAAALFLMGDDRRGHRLSAQYFEDPNDVNHIVDEINKLVHEGVLKPFPTVFSWLLRFNTLKEVYLHISKGRSDEAVKMYIENLAAQILCAIYAAKPNYVYRFSP